MKELQADPFFELLMIAGGTHYSPQHGYTVRELEADGFRPNETIEFVPANDSGVAAAQSLGLATIGFASALSRLKPSVLVVLGDRFEILAAAGVGMILGIPIAHIAGGDLTEGALDDAVRHSLTKLSQAHFVTNAPAADVVRQLGEDPRKIFIVGSPSLDILRQGSLLTRESVEERLGMSFSRSAPNILVTFHPETRSRVAADTQISELLQALGRLSLETRIIITSPNADPGYAPIMKALCEFVAERRLATYHQSLGQELYLSTMACVDVVVGNSSSGLYEAPSLKKPSVDIGDRQARRVAASSVIRCGIERDQIINAIQAALAIDCSNVVNPYGDGRSALRIVSILRELISEGFVLRKRFFGLNE